MYIHPIENRTHNRRLYSHTVVSLRHDDLIQILNVDRPKKFTYKIKCKQFYNDKINILNCVRNINILMFRKT